MNGFVYGVIWIVLTLFPVLAAWKRCWIATGIYSLGWLIFLIFVLRSHGGWDDLVDVALLLFVVVPTYAVASIVWLVELLKKRRQNR